MLFSALLVFAYQGSATVTIGKTNNVDSTEIARRRARFDTLAARSDSTRAVRDSIAKQRRIAKKIPLTPQLLTDAFRDPAARELLNRARAMRLSQDSTLTSYDATVYERLNVTLQAGKWGRARQLFRNERASRVRWDRANGAVVDLTGYRSAALGGNSVDVRTGPVPIPYFPGRDAFGFATGVAQADVTDEAFINPLANGAEAYYIYTPGDSLAFQMGGGKRVIVRELLVRPRAPRWNVVVGSLWFDVATGQLVRAVYRLAEPIDILAAAKEGDNVETNIPFLVRPFVTPMQGRLDVITIDYGLFEGRFWLPRVQLFEGEGRMGAIRIPLSIQQRFDYASVNETLDIPPIQIAVNDTARTVDAHRQRREAREQACKDQSQQRVNSRLRYDRSLKVQVRVPCDTALLARSPSLPPSLMTPTDTMFNRGELDRLIDRALGLGQQPDFAVQPPKFQFGLPLTTYNRVEGLATGIEARQSLGGGYEGMLLLRFGASDLRPKAELSLARTNGRRTIAASAYSRIVAVNDWGNFLTFGSSVSAAVLGRDEGMYYYTGGAELRYENRDGLLDSWRLFLEDHTEARMRSSFSVLHAMRPSHRFQPNIKTTEGQVAGLELRRTFNVENVWGRVRFSGDLRGEGAVGSFDYTRGLADVTVASPLVSVLDAALTLSGGTSGGTLPWQRLWYLGGTHTVRGQSIASGPGTVGNSYWLTRLELGRTNKKTEPAFAGNLISVHLFGDLGWAGDRQDWLKNGRPINGVGLGITLFNGVFRYELAKGVSPNRSIRGYLYLDARF